MALVGAGSVGYPVPTSALAFGRFPRRGDRGPGHVNAPVGGPQALSVTSGAPLRGGAPRDFSTRTEGEPCGTASCSSPVWWPLLRLSVARPGLRDLKSNGRGGVAAPYAAAIDNEGV
jgi:hypothetical protein